MQLYTITMTEEVNYATGYIHTYIHTFTQNLNIKDLECCNGT